MKKVFLGVGHGGADSGAVGNGLKEKDLNLGIALACRDELQANGVDVKMSREKDENDPLNDEVAECNAFSPDLAVDTHNNAGGGDGAECWYQHKSGTAKTLADNILSEIVKIGQNSRGAKTRLNSKGTDYYGFLRNVKAPAVIVECAFIDNATDIQIVDTAAEQKAMGIAIAKGILKTLGIEAKPVETVTPATQPTTTSKSIDEVAREVIDGQWGNGLTRRARLEAAGYNYRTVQQRVNDILSGKMNINSKSVEQIAKEVIAGKWGNGADRKRRIEAAGYNYAEVQKKVNELMKK